MLCIQKSQSSALGPGTSISWVTLLWLRLFFPDKLRYRVNCKSYHFSYNLKWALHVFYVLVSDVLSLSSGVLNSCIAKRYVHVLWSINSVQVNYHLTDHFVPTREHDPVCPDCSCSWCSVGCSLCTDCPFGGSKYPDCSALWPSCLCQANEPRASVDRVAREIVHTYGDIQAGTRDRAQGRLVWTEPLRRQSR
jgi:hypothetical protein